MKNKKLFQSLAIVGTFFFYSSAHAQTASIESEVGVSQQYVDSIMNSMGVNAQSSYEFSADYQIIGPQIHDSNQVALRKFRELIGILGVSSGLSSAIKDYNNMVKGHPESLAVQMQLLQQAVGTAETLYQAAIASLYRELGSAFIDHFNFPSGQNLKSYPVSVSFADKSEISYATSYPHLYAVYEDAFHLFPRHVDNPSDGSLSASNTILINSRYSDYLNHVCGSQYCISNVLASWSRYYNNLNEWVNRDLTIVLADGNKITIHCLKNSNGWHEKYETFFDAISRFRVGDDFVNLQIKLTTDEWPVQPAVQN